MSNIKEERMKNSLNILDSQGIRYTTHNGGFHLVIVYYWEEVHFWPTTGKFWYPRRKAKGCDIHNLLSLLKGIKESYVEPLPEKQELPVTLFSKLKTFFRNLFNVK